MRNNATIIMALDKSAGRRGGCDGMFRGPRGSKGTQVMCAIHAKMPRGPQGSKVKRISRHSTKILRTLVLKKF